MEMNGILIRVWVEHTAIASLEIFGEGRREEIKDIIERELIKIIL